MKSWIIKLVVVLVILAGLGTGAGWYIMRRSDSDVSFRTSTVSRGDLLVFIDSTGTVEPEEVVDVGAQVSGLILSFGPAVDGQPVNYGSTVTEGMVLAKIDDAVYKAQVDEADAQVAQAEAAIQRAEADLLQMKAKLVQAQNDWERAEKLGPSEALAQTSYDAYKSAFETAKANVAIDEAAILQAKATRDQSVAAASAAHRNLSYCIITSPVNGVVIDRRVNIGQTVVSSMNASSLFLLAKDLKRMQVWVPVNEADIGRLQPGMPVTFTVEAFPGETFHGTVGRVRLNAAMTQNVVTYTVEVVAENSNNRLLPYLTANVKFELDRKSDVLQVASGALRWRPQVEQMAPEYRANSAEWLRVGNTRGSRRGGPSSSPASGPTSRPSRRRAESSSSSAPAESGRGVVWVADGKFVRPIRVQTGVTDGSVTEIAGADIKEGMELIIGAQTAVAGAASSGTSNPFAPPPRFGPPRPANAGGAGGTAGGAAGGTAGGTAGSPSGGSGGGAGGAGRGAGGGGGGGGAR